MQQPQCFSLFVGVFHDKSCVKSRFSIFETKWRKMERVKHNFHTTFQCDVI